MLAERGILGQRALDMRELAIEWAEVEREAIQKDGA